MLHINKMYYILYAEGTNSYIRPESFNEMKDTIESTENTSSNDDLSHLRFGFTKTAFDTDIDTLPDQPWKKPRVDISDYFNYGLTESTWKVKF